MTTKPKATRRPSGVVALSALEVLVGQPKGMGLTELARRLDLDGGQLHRALNGLVVTGYVDQDPDTHHYLPTAKIVSVAGSLLGSMDLVRLAKSHMLALRNATGETVHLATRTRDGAICIARELSEHPVSVATEVGERFGASTAVAQSMSALGTASNLDALGSHVQFVTDDGAARRGVRCAAAAVVDWERQAIAAIAVSGPADRISDMRLVEIGELVSGAAADLSASLGAAH